MRDTRVASYATLRGVDTTAFARRFETRYVTRANLATRYASRARAREHASIRNAVESGEHFGYRYGHFALSLAPATGKKGEAEPRRPVASGNLGTRTFAPSPVHLLGSMPSLHLRYAYAIRARVIARIIYCAQGGKRCGREAKDTRLTQAERRRREERKERVTVRGTCEKMVKRVQKKGARRCVCV